MNSFFKKNEIQSLYQYAFVLTRDSHNAHDALQNAIEKYLVNIKLGINIKNKMMYTRTIIRNSFIDDHRNKKRFIHEIFEEQGNYDISPINLEELHINKQQLTIIWQKLDHADREILYYWAVLGYSTDEACKILHIPRGTFLSRLHRLRKKHSDKNDSVTIIKKGGS